MEFVDKITTRRSEQFVIKYPCITINHCMEMFADVWKRRRSNVSGMGYIMQKNKEELNIHEHCNVCGKKLTLLPSGEQEETLTVDKTWGYFSGKDTVRHTFAVCEDCYDKWIASFAVAPFEEQASELL